MKTKAIILELIASLLIILWGYAAITKLLDYSTFRIQLSRSPLLTDMVQPVAIIIPMIELITVGMLLWHELRIWGFYLSLFLLVLFTSYIVSILNFSYSIPCSCGGVLSSLGWRNHIVFNLVFMLLATIGIVIQTKRNKKCKSAKYNAQHRMI